MLPAASYRLQQIDAAITFAIEGREKENQQTQDGAADGQFDMRMILETGKHILTSTHHTDEIE